MPIKHLILVYFSCFLALAACTPEPETAVPPTPPLATTIITLPASTATSTSAMAVSPTVALIDTVTAMAVSASHAEPMAPPDGLTTAVVIVGDKAYTAVGSSLVTLDISDPTQPVRLGYLTLPAIEEESLYPDWIRIQDVAVNGNYAYLAATDGLWLVEVSDPSAPVPLDLYETLEPATAVAIVDHYALVTAAIFSDRAGGLRVVDVSNPAALVEVGAYKEAAGLTDDVVVNGNTAYLMAGYGLRVIDISDPSTPKEIGRSAIAGHRLAVIDDFLYMADWSIGLRVLDVSDPALPIEAVNLRIPGVPQGISVVDNIAYVANGSGGLVLVDVTAAPVEMGSYEVSYALDVAASNGYAYVATDGGLVVLDVANPTMPLAVGLMPPNGVFAPGPTTAPTPVPSPVVTSSADPLVISPENVAQLTQLAQFGNGQIGSVSWSPDGKIFTVGGSQGLTLYDAATLEVIHTIEDEYGAGDVSYSVSFSPKGDVLIVFIAAPYFHIVRLWDIASRQYLRDLDAETMPVFTPDGESVIFKPVGQQQLVWQDVRSGETQHTTMRLELQPDSYSIFSPSLETAAEVNADGTVRLWDAASGQLQHTLEMPVIANGFHFSPQGELLAASGVDSVVRVWDVQSGELLYELAGHTDSVDEVIFSPDGRILVTGSRDGTVRVWDRQSGELLHLLEGHTRWIDGGVGFSPDGGILVSSGEDQTVHLWDTATGQLLHELTRLMPPPGWSSSSVTFSPDGRELAAVSGGSVLFFDVAGGALQHTLDGYSFAPGLAFSPDSSALITVSGYEVLTLGVPSGVLLHTRLSDEPVRSIAISPDGGLMAWGGGGQQYWLQLWDRTTDQLLYTIAEEAGPVSRVTFSPDRQLLATQSGYWPDSVVQLREANTGNLLFSHKASSFAFNPDGRLFATSLQSEDPEKDAVELWDATTFQLVRRFEQLTLLAFSPDGNILAQRSAEDWLVDVDSGELLHTLVDMESPSSVMNFSPDGRLFLGANDYSTMEMWDAVSGQGVWGQYFGQSGAFSEDGRFLATVSYDGIVRLWGLPSSSNE